MTLVTKITREGQPFYDEAVYATPKPASPVEASIAAMFKRQLPQPMQIGHERVRLQWMKPDGKGGLVPKKDS